MARPGNEPPASRLPRLVGVALFVRRVLVALPAVLAMLACPLPAAAQSPDAALQTALRKAMAPAGGQTGALVVDETDGRVVYALRPDVPRVPASNQKLWITATALQRYGAQGTLPTRVFGVGQLQPDGTFRGNLHLRGAGDPTFGSLSFTRRAYGGGATTYQLAGSLAAAGIRRVQGSILGDESIFDRRRGPYSSGIAAYVGGPLSGLSYDRGLSSASGAGFQRRPATFAASQLIVALRARGIQVSGPAGEARTPAGARELVRANSLPMSTISRLTNRPSDNYLAEMLIKAMGASFGGSGTTPSGARVVSSHLRGMGIGARVVDGSGLSRLNRASPRQLVNLLTAMDRSSVAGPFRDSLAVAGRSGTLASRMRGTTAAGRCRGKTGTLNSVSSLSGYCDTVGGRRLAFSILMNGVSASGGRALQNAATVAIARYSVRAGAAAVSSPAPAARPRR